MKLAIAVLACMGLVVAGNSNTENEERTADKTFLEKQKFLFEIVYRVEEPLMFEEWIKLGKEFVVDKSYYSHYDMNMEKFYESFKMGALLPKMEFFGALAKTHAKQALGLFNFFYHATDWETFRHNVCWARMHVNEGMFVYALNLAVIHRNDFEGLMLPSIYEIFPQHFFNSKFIYAAEKFDFDVWSKLAMYEKEFNDVLYKNDKLYFGNYMKDWKTWQWWKLMGLGELWYNDDKFFLRENINDVNHDRDWLTMIKGIDAFWMPVDYTRNIEIFNDHTKLSYFTEDLGWNSYWYYLNMDYSFFLDSETFGLSKDRRGEFWMYNIQQLLSRYYMERLSHGFGDIPEFPWYSQIETGYDPELIAYNGIGFSYRKNYWDMQTYGNFDMLANIRIAIHRIYNIIDSGFYKMQDGTMIDFRKPAAIEHIGNLLQGNMDVFDKYFFNYWYLLSHMYFADVGYTDLKVNPHVFMNYETMMRDPMFYMLYKQIADVFYRFQYHFAPYTRDELILQGVELKDVRVSELVTYFDFVDFDVTNLLNDKMRFVDGQFVWDKTLLARQMRLNHKPFDFNFTIESDEAHKVVIRTFIAPKYDEFGRVISLTDNRMNFFKFDEFVYELVAGKNLVHRESEQFYWTVHDRITYTELYHYMMMAIDGKYNYPLDISEPHCGFPDRLILPRGWEKGMPMQFFFMVTPYMADYEQIPDYNYTYSYLVGTGLRHIDNLPFVYPFDRVVDEHDFLVPNMYFKDVEIFHIDTFESYRQDYKNYGQFDYSFFNNYYAKDC